MAWGLVGFRLGQKPERNVAASSLQRPPTSLPKTTWQHRRSWRGSGWVRSLFPFASLEAVPRYCLPRVRRETKVVSPANWPARVRRETKVVSPAI